MRKLGAAALAAGMLLAGQAGAAIMQASLGGDFDDVPTLQAWNATFVYDTALGQLTDGVDIDGFHYETLTWNAAMGTPSPLISLTGQTQGSDGKTFSYSDFTSFTVSRNDYDYFFDFSGPGVSGSLGYFGTTVPVAPDGDDSLVEPYSLTTLNCCSSATGFAKPPSDGAAYFLTSLSVTKIGESPSAAPEPATWALLLAGFFGLGGVLRRQRRVLA